MKLKIEASGSDSSGRKKNFILSNYSEVTLTHLIDLIKKEVIEGLIIVKGKFGTHIRSVGNKDPKDNLSCLTIICNKKDYLLFNGQQLMLMTINGRIKKVWPANSGMPGSTSKDQHRKDYGPLPEGEYTINFDQTLDYENRESISDGAKWIVKAPTWGMVVTPLTPNPSNNMYGRDSFTIHGGWFKGTKGCIELQEHNREFHITARLYKRNFHLVVRYE
jgi:hypothetical protein